MRFLIPLVLLTGTASAQEADAEIPPPAGPSTVDPTPPLPPPPPPAPAIQQPRQNEDWNNVSHINGQIVPVGQRTDYLYKFRRTNIASNPIGWLTGFYGLSVSSAISNNVALRGDVNLISFDNGRSSGYEVGASAPIYFRRTYSGPFIEPGLIVRNVYDHAQDDIAYGPGGTYSSGHPASIGPSMVFGWHWTFDSGLNVAAAFGVMRNLNQKQSEYDYNNDDIQPSGYFRIGYAF